MELLGDGSCADWLSARTGDWARVDGVAGRGLEAYARILHPVPATRLDLAVADAWGMHPVLEETRWPWSEVAQRQGLTMHPLVQWNRLADIHDGVRFEDGWRVGQTQDGYLEPPSLRDLVELLAEWTATPGELVAGFWEGWGELGLPGAPQLSWQGREMFLCRTSTAELSDPLWAERGGFSGLSPQLLWPADRAWVVASEIDWDSTIVAGARLVVDSVLADERFEAFEVGAHDDLTWEGDTINPPRAGWPG